MFVRHLTLISALCLSQALAQNITGLPLRPNMTIFQARHALLREGWQPVETFAKTGFDELAHSSGDAAPIYRRGLREVERCTGVEVNYCFFNYRKNKQCLMVFTSGEYIPNKAPKVDDWSVYSVPGAGTNNSKPLCSEAAWTKTPSSARIHGVQSR